MDKLDYFENGHEYYVNGIEVPSVTTMLKVRFGGKYDGIPEATLRRAAEKGTDLHKRIENLINGGEAETREEKSFLTLMRLYHLEPIKSEVPVILYQDGEPFAAGRLDMILRDGDRIGIGDLKRTSTLDKEYLTYQLNLYKRAYEQTFGERIDFLVGIHIREEKRKLVQITINDNYADEIITEWKETK